VKKFISGLTVLLLSMIFSYSANAAPGDLFVLVELRGGPGATQCSILKVKPDGTFTEFLSFTDILALTGLASCDLEDTGLAIADNGDLYFAEDDSDTIIKATPAGVLSTFVTKAQIMAATGAVGADIDDGMAIGPDGDLYFSDEFSDTVLKATIPGGAVSLILSKQQLEAVGGDGKVDLDGGMDFDCIGNLYFSSTPAGESLIYKLSSSGILSVFVSDQELKDATGFNFISLKTDMSIFDFLFTLDEGLCNCVLRITLDGVISVFVSEAQITAATGEADAQPDGGIALNQSRQVFFGDDRFNPFILMSSKGSSVSIVASAQEIQDFYAPAGFTNPQLRGSMEIEGVDPCLIPQIPTLSEWGLIVMAGILGIVGFMVMRRRKVTA